MASYNKIDNSYQLMISNQIKNFKHFYIKLFVCINLHTNILIAAHTNVMPALSEPMLFILSTDAVKQTSLCDIQL